MKNSLSFSLLILSAAAMATAFAAEDAAAPAAVSGKWQVNLSVMGHDAAVACRFAQGDGGQLSGDCAGEQGKAELTGKVEGKNVTWTYKTASSQGGMVTLVYTGKPVSATKMTGSVNVVEYGVAGDFTATHQ